MPCAEGTVHARSEASQSRPGTDLIFATRAGEWGKRITSRPPAPGLMRIVSGSVSIPFNKFESPGSSRARRRGRGMRPTRGLENGAGTW